MGLITVIGRGNSGTRVMSHTLSQSGVFMGWQQNPAGDLMPPDPLYEACREMAQHISLADGDWDVTSAIESPPSERFCQLVFRYLQPILTSGAKNRGWKLPETTLVLPWITQLLPEARCIWWVRDPRDNILSKHKTDDLSFYNIPTPDVDALLSTRYSDLREMAIARGSVPEPSVPWADASWSALDELRVRLRRALSWKFQYDLIEATPKPKSWLMVRYEDFILDQRRVLKELSRFVQVPLVRVPVSSDAVGRWQRDDFVTSFDFLERPIAELGYNGVVSRRRGLW